MKGTHLTSEQLLAAEKFILLCSGRTKRTVMIMQRFDDLVRLVAWYGALRYRAGRDGTGGTLEQPHDVRLANHEQSVGE